MSVPALEFRSVTVRYEPQGKAVLDNLSFSVAPGERVALLGMNGSGKTTILLTAVGLLDHVGEVLVSGEAMTQKTRARARERVGFLFSVPDDQLLFPRVLDDVAFGLLRRGVERAQALGEARRALEALGVGALADFPVHHLSHGQRQRVALAGAIVGHPDLLLLDEPSSSLDPVGKRKLAGYLLDTPIAMLLATHDLGFAMKVAQRFLVIDHGRLVLDTLDPSEAARALDPEA